MSAPESSDLMRLKGWGIYVIGGGGVRQIIWLEFQKTPVAVVVWTDSDHVGRTNTRERTSGGLVMFGSHFAKSWSSSQGVVALSSGEAEFYGIAKGAS